MRKLIPGICIILSLINYSCEKTEEVISGDPGLLLEFSADTVSFDTIFTVKESITQRLRVFNRNDEALLINSIDLGSGAGSAFSLTVNGIAGKEFEDIVLNGRDSLLVLVEVFIDSQNEDLPFLIEDDLRFSTNGNQEEVKLIAYGQDAIRFSNQVLPCNMTWTADRPYLLMDTILVDSLCQLVIEKGARIFLEPETFLFIAGTLHVLGEAGETVIFKNSRKDFDDIPGQWEGIYFLEGSKDNRIEFAEIRNGWIGLRVGTPDADTIPDVVVKNSIIENMANSGLLSFNSDVRMENTLINNCAVFTVGNLLGGNYYYEHCTFATFGFDFFRNDASTVFSDNIVLPDNSTLESDLHLELSHSIIWGSLTEEIIISESSGNNSLTFDRNILKTQLTLPGIGNLINQDPRFEAPEDGNYRLDSLSPGINAIPFPTLPTDLPGEMRDTEPDMGAYERL